MAKAKRRPTRKATVSTRRSRPPRTVLLSIDQGTTGSKALLVDDRLRVLAEVTVEFRQIYPRPGWVEHAPTDLWGSVREAVRKAIRAAKISPKAIAAIGITNQRETTLIWDLKSGRPIHNAIVWQDRRTAKQCASLVDKGLENTVRKRTGLVLDPYFSGTKIAWILREVSGARQRARAGKLCFGTVDTYLLYRLTGGDVHATDVSNASRTLLMNLRRSEWDKDMLDLLRIPRELLPRIAPNDEIFGHTRGLDFLPDGIPIAGLIGDQQSALFGQACFRSGEAKCTYGTGAFLLMNTGTRPVFSRHGMLTTAAWQLQNKSAASSSSRKKSTNTVYALEGSAFIAGAIVQWLRDGLGIIKTAPEIEKLALSVPDSGEVTVVPALTGLGAPHWQPEARGLITGLTRGSTSAHIARAALEGIAFQNLDILRAMEQDLDKRIRVLKVDGGAAANNLLLQFQADILRTQISRPRILGTTSLGAAMLAGLATGVFGSLAEIERVWAEDRRFRPTMKRREVDAHVTRWHEAVAKS